ncbi:MAG TPA: aminoglycoside phosphotransferase, partial [Sulfitobacter sp.]|nr:aminoglycoside phosphotransferase [Sulfitobacter sp.]
MAQMNDRMTAMDRFLVDAGWAQARRDLLAGDASNRRYDRLTLDDGRTAVLMDAPADKGEDVRPFVRIADWLRAQGASAPEIYAQDAGNGFLLIEDLGDDLFARLMVQSPAMTLQLYTAATDCLLDLHKAPPPDLPLCDADWLTEAAQMVFDWYAPDSGAAAEFNTLFTPLARALDNSPRVIILRDYHAENLLWRPE